MNILKDITIFKVCVKDCEPLNFYIIHVALIV